MNISRRHFILGTAGGAAGLILPSYYQRALEFLDRTGKPLLESVARPSTELFVSDWYGQLKYSLCVGDPEAGPPQMTLRQFSDHYDIDLFEVWYFEEGENPDWDREIDWSEEIFFDTWIDQDGPEKKAYELLKAIDLGPEFNSEDSVGELRLDHGHTMVSSYWNVEVPDEISLSLLQDRLNALNTGIRIKMAC
jgi:hypothetical protein